MKILIFFICYLFLGVLQLSGQIVADAIPKSMDLVGHKNVKAWQTSPDNSFETVRNHGNWKPFDASFTSSPKSTIWLKFELNNTSKDTITSYLYSAEHFTTIYQEGTQGFERFENGYFLPLQRRSNPSDQLFTELCLLPFQSSQVYVNLNTNNINTNGPKIVLYSENGYWTYSNKRYAYQVKSIGFIYFYIVSLIAIFIFALVFWLSLRDRLYFYYLGYLFFQIIYGFLILQFTIAPIANFFEYVPELAVDLIEPVQFAFIGFYIFFVLRLLQIEKYDKLLSKILYYTAICLFLYAISRFVFSQYFLGDKYADILFLTIRIIVLPLNFIFLFWIIFKVKHPLLVYFIIGQSFFFLGSILSTYVWYIGATSITGHFFNFKSSPDIIFQIGLLLEVYCFSLALGKNVFLLQKEKEQAHTELIDQLQENQYLQETMNRELDGKVQKKTEELIQLYSEIEREKEQKTKDDFNKRIKEIEMVALRSQMNPHFIFNSMNAIKNLIMTSRNEDAIAYLDDFASLLREILQNSNREKITVEEELEILELYLSLEKSRIGKNFNYTIQVDSKEALSQYQIPPLLLQPIVENAIWHGLHPSLKAEKKLTILFDTTDDLKIVIEDNGIGRKASAEKKKLHNSLGTTIVQDRLTLYNHLNDHAIYLKITDLEEDGNVLGTRITLTYNY